MTDLPSRPVLITGASGALGRQTVAALGQLGWALRLTDIAPFPDTLPATATFEAADLEDGPAILRIAEGCGSILHYGGIAVDRPFETVIGPNIRGVYHVYEAARRERARVVFASSNHAVGFHHRSAVLDADAALRPDSFYGLSKAYGELMGRLYWDKHGVENVNLRIGSSFPQPVDDRMLATWLSYGDINRFMACCVLAPGPVGHCMVWGTSRNGRQTFWRQDHRDRVGWAPQDSADAYETEAAGKGLGNPFVDTLIGGGYTAAGVTRSAPSAAELFALD